MVAAARVLKILGQQAPQKPSEAERKAQRIVRAGLPASVVVRLAKAYAVPAKEIERLVGVPATTRGRRQKAGKPLKLGDSDRAFRLGRILAFAEQVLEGREKAQRWLAKPNRALGGDRPLDLLDTEAGTERVEQLLGQIEYGVYS